MKKARLIKKGKLPELQPTQPSATAQTSTIKHTMKTVQHWVKEQRASQREQARQIFAALFIQPQA
ncbi:MAG: hypothetical protein JST84_21355 [Acidobacteria bacterium]|nr:hypothetical protein [Acidobacteriota bacterium]